MTGRELLTTWRADMTANAGNPKGRFVVTAFRLASWARGTGAMPLWAVPVIAAYRLVVDWAMGIEIPPTVPVGPGLRVWHGTGLVVHANVRIGSDVTLRHGVTLGALGESIDAPGPVIGDGVNIGPGAIILGGRTIGDGAVIGAGSIVVDDVAPGATVAGNPARELTR